MMSFRAQLKTIEMDLGAEIAKLEKQIGEENARATANWLDAVTSIVPVWSGASQSTFVKLAQAVGFPLRPVKVPGAPERRLLGFLSSQGGVEKRGPGRIGMFYRTRLKYLIFNNDNVAVRGVGGVIWGLITPTPYKFIQAGVVAYMRVASQFKLQGPTIKGKRI
jgi:hypothetical protein